jgi:ABC-2 type transport system permease protein
MRLILSQWFTFAKLTMQEMLKPLVLGVGIILPIVLVAIFGDVNVGDLPKPRIGLVNTLDTPVLTSVREVLSEGDFYRVIEKSEAELSKELKSFTIDPRENLSAYIRPQKDGLEIVARDSADQLRENLEKITTTLNAELAIDEFPDKRRLLKSKSRVVQARESTYLDFTMPGLIGITLISTLVYGTAISLEKLFESGVLRRIFLSPTRKWVFFLGRLTAKALFSVGQVSLLFLVAYLLYNYQAIDTYTSMIQTVVLVLPASAMLMSIGYWIAGTFTDTMLINGLTQLVVFPQILLSGTFIPVTDFDEKLKVIAQAMPLYQVNEAIREITINGQNLWDWSVVYYLLIMLAWTVFFTTLTLKNFKFR